MLVQGLIDDSLVLVAAELVERKLNLLKVRRKLAVSHHALVA